MEFTVVEVSSWVRLPVEVRSGSRQVAVDGGRWWSVIVADEQCFSGCALLVAKLQVCGVAWAVVAMQLSCIGLGAGAAGVRGRS